MSPAERATQRQPQADPRFRDEVLSGLRGTPKTLSPKFFYDDRGAALFEQICEQPEYYLTRAELEILRARAPEIAALAGPRAALVEFGSGAGVKIRLLLDALESPVSYTPIDISKAQLARVAARLGAEYPGITVRPLHADYTAPLELPRLPDSARRRVAFFPGSTIGNFHPAQAAVFLQRARHAIGRDGALILGVDRRKDKTVLDAAYNDAAGITAAFNMNLLVRLNRELDATFDLRRFRHLAYFNEEASRVEMHLESLDDQVVQVAGEPIAFARGETIWTESSYKYDLERLRALVSSAGFEIERAWTDANERFWVTWLRSGTRGGASTRPE